MPNADDQRNKNTLNLRNLSQKNLLLKEQGTRTHPFSSIELFF